MRVAEGSPIKKAIKKKRKNEKKTCSKIACQMYETNMKNKQKSEPKSIEKPSTNRCEKNMKFHEKSTKNHPKNDVNFNIKFIKNQVFRKR